MDENPNLQDYDDLIDDLPPYEEENGVTGADKQIADKKVTTYIKVNSAGFKDFLLKSELNRAIVDCGFEQPALQQEAIPYAMMGRDVVCQAVLEEGV